MEMGNTLAQCLYPKRIAEYISSSHKPARTRFHGTGVLCRPRWQRASQKVESTGRERNSIDQQVAHDSGKGHFRLEPS